MPGLELELGLVPGLELELGWVVGVGEEPLLPPHPAASAKIAKAPKIESKTGRRNMENLQYSGYVPCDYYRFFWSEPCAFG